ncbi:hypothetical protein EBZ80_22375 [bacterium]|nr:hypothetical protein [bacterium]
MVNRFIRCSYCLQDFFQPLYFFVAEYVDALLLETSHVGKIRFQSHVNPFEDSVKETFALISLVLLRAHDCVCLGSFGSLRFSSLLLQLTHQRHFPFAFLSMHTRHEVVRANAYGRV